MVTKRNSKPARKSGKTVRKTKAQPAAGRKIASHKPAKATNARAAALARTGKKGGTKAKAAKPVAAKPKSAAKKPVAKKPVAKKPAAKKPAAAVTTKTAARPASVKTAAKAVAAARASASKRRAPSYIPRSRFNDDWMATGPVELPRQPNPAAHTPTRKPPKPRAPKPKAISHEQAVANLKALLESRKRKDRGGDAGTSAKGA
ncbi:MAG: hypothetical protein ACREPZ_01030 [Rhodanobacteraceae bacterium]